MVGFTHTPVWYLDDRLQEVTKELARKLVSIFAERQRAQLAREQIEWGRTLSLASGSSQG